jgi:hypothetical protein
MSQSLTGVSNQQLFDTWNVINNFEVIEGGTKAAKASIEREADMRHLFDRKTSEWNKERLA